MGSGRFLVAGACSLAAVVLMPIAASAHAFLVQTSPAPGQRLLTSPPSLTLQFSEAVASNGIEVAVRDAHGELVKTPPPRRDPGGDVVQVRLPVLPPDVYEVQWQVVSADDGHFSVGSFAFGVGKASIPAATQAAAEPTDWLQAAGRFLFLAGLAFSVGLLVNAAWVWRAAGFAEPSDSGLLLGIPLGAAALGASTQLGLFLWRVSSGGTSVFASTLWQSLLQAPAGRNELIAFVSVLIAGGIVVARGTRRLVLLPLVLAAVAAALTTHPASARAWWGLLAIAVHLLLALLWFGMLAHIVVVIAVRRPALPRTSVLPAVRRYARIALWSAAGVLVTGLLAALAEFTSFAQLVTTSYGKVLLVKVGVVLVALLAAAGLRLRALRSTGNDRIAMIRRLTGVEAVLLLGVFALSSLLGAVAQPAVASTAVANVPELGPPPSNGPAIDLAGQAGWWEVYLAASSGQLTVTTVSPGPTPPPDLSLSLLRRDPTAAWSPLRATGCGVGCLTATVRWTAGTTEVEVQASSHRWPGGKIDFSVPWPPVAGDRGLLADVIKRMKGEPNVSVDERVTSGPGATGQGVYTMGGSIFLQGEPYGPDTANLEALPDRNGLKILVVVLPGSQIWVQLAIDASKRLRAETIVDPGHLIERSFSYP